MPFFLDYKLSYFTHFIVAKILRCPSQILMDNVQSLSNERILLLLAENGERIARDRERNRREKDREKGRKRYASEFAHLCTPWISIALHLGHGSSTRLMYSANERSLADLYAGERSCLDH